MKYSLVIVNFFIYCTVSAQVSTIISTDKSLSVQYPYTWKASAEQYKQTAVINLKPAAAGEVTVVFEIQRALLPPNIKTLDQLVAEQIAQIKKEEGVNTFNENKRIGNKHLLSYEFMANGKRIKMKSYTWLDGGFIISAMFGTEPIEYNAYMAEVETIIKSIGAPKPGAANTTTTVATGQLTSTKTGSLIDVDCSIIPGFNLISKSPVGITPIEKYGSVRLTDGKKFQVEISKAVDYSIANEKKGLAANTMNELKKYVIDEPNGVLYQSEAMGQTQYHFKYLLSTDKGSYYFEDLKGVQYDLASVQLMYKAAKESTIKGASGNGNASENSSTQKTVNTIASVAAVIPAGTNKGAVVSGAVQAAPGIINKLKKKDTDKEEANATNSNTDNGGYELKDDAGNLVEKGQYKNGKKTGKWQYFEKGKLSQESDYLEGKLNGKKIDYHENGNKTSEISYLNGDKNGAQITYSFVSGNVTLIIHYVNGQMEGEYKKYTDSGTLLEEGNYKNGKKDGSWNKYDSKGKLTKTLIYVDGKQQD